MEKGKEEEDNDVDEEFINYYIFINIFCSLLSQVKKKKSDK